MDEALVSAAVDFGGRAAFVYRADTLKGRLGRHLRRELGREFFGGFVGRRALQPPPGGPLRRERPPHDRGAVQGVRAGDVGGGAPRPARGRRAVHQGNAHVVSANASRRRRRSGKRQPAQRREGAGRASARRRRRSPPTPTRSRGRTSWWCRARARSAPARPGWTAAAGALRQAVLDVIHARPAVPRHLHRHAAPVRDSEENPDARGLGILPGRVRRFAEGPGLKIPHMGWNATRRGPAAGAAPRRRPRRRLLLFRAQLLPGPGAGRGRGPRRASTAWSSARRSARDNLFACQFHPEKSQAAGLALLGGFARG